MKTLTAALLLTALAAPVSATTLRITVTNTQGDTGFALAPVYSAFHDGSFDSVTVGETVTAGVETLAELGNPAAVRAERIAALPNSAGAAVSAGALLGGATQSTEVEITDFENQRFFSFLSMILPSNDLFIANDDATAFNLFNDDGSFIGTQTIAVNGLNVFDAGTEVNDASVTGGAAFVAGSAAPGGVNIESGSATAGFAALEDFLGVETAPGFVLASGTGTGFFSDISNASQFSLATITIEEVAPVPLPAGGMLLLSGLAFGGFAARRKAKRA